MLTAFLFLSLSTKYIVVDLSSYSWIAYKDNKEVKRGEASGGRKWCPDIKRRCKTPTGLFPVISKKNRAYRSPLYPVGCDNKTNNKCAPMPWAVKFRHSGEAIHGHRSKITAHTSHGCIHVSYEDAKWINEFLDVGDIIDIRDY